MKRASRKTPSVIPGARPRFLEGERPEAVLLLHGWTGYPGQNYFLADRLNLEGFTVALPRLPGHGTDANDFRSRSGDEWIGKAVDAYLELSTNYEKVFVAGVSMGALLALILAARFDPAGIVLAAPAMEMKDRRVFLAPLLKGIIKDIPVQDDEESEDPDEEYIRREYWSWRRLDTVAELLRVRRHARRGLSRVSCPVCILETDKDSLVPLTAGANIKRRIRSAEVEMHRLTESSHQIFNGVEREKAAGLIIDWLNKVSRPSILTQAD